VSNKKRIIGIDVARALAIFGMIIVNFKIVLGEHGDNVFKVFASLLTGKAAALFVVLAGVGFALMSNSAVKNQDYEKIKTIKKKIFKRAIFLFIVGFSYILIWPADILHFYGIYMLLTLIFIAKKPKYILFAAAFLIFIYPFLYFFLDYQSDWNLITLEYTNLWTFKGIIRNLFYNGFHPVIPWTAFMLVGLWFGKQDLNNDKFIKKTFIITSSFFILIQAISFILIKVLSNGEVEKTEEMIMLFGTEPMPPMPIYMLNGIFIALAVISLSIFIARRFKDNKIIEVLNKTGQLALTFYVAHIIIGMGFIEEIDPSMLGKYSIEFSVIYGLIFSIFCSIFAVIWLKYKKSGPIEWLMRKLTN